MLFDIRFSFKDIFLPFFQHIWFNLVQLFQVKPLQRLAAVLCQLTASFHNSSSSCLLARLSNMLLLLVLLFLSQSSSLLTSLQSSSEVPSAAELVSAIEKLVKTKMVSVCDCVYVHVHTGSFPLRRAQTEKT